MNNQSISIDSILPSDCGKKVKLMNLNYVYEFEAEIQMIITSPKGRLIIFSSDIPKVQDAQSEAVRTFVEIHKND